VKYIRKKNDEIINGKKCDFFLRDIQSAEMIAIGFAIVIDIKATQPTHGVMSWKCPPPIPN